MNKPNTFPLWLFIITPATSALVLTITLITHGYNEDGLPLTARYTVRVGLPLFLLAYSASALTRLFPPKPLGEPDEIDVISASTLPSPTSFI